jgi:hypothetical protein
VVRDGRVVNELNAVAFWIAHVERPSAVSVSLRRLVQGDSLFLQVRGPRVHVVRTSENDTEVVQSISSSLRERIIRWCLPVQRKVIAPTMEVDIVRVRAPLDLHSEDAHIEVLDAREVGDAESDVPDANGAGRDDVSDHAVFLRESLAWVDSCSFERVSFGVELRLRRPAWYEKGLPGRASGEAIGQERHTNA